MHDRYTHNSLDTIVMSMLVGQPPPHPDAVRKADQWCIEVRAEEIVHRRGHPPYPRAWWNPITGNSQHPGMLYRSVQHALADAGIYVRNQQTYHAQRPHVRLREVNSDRVIPVSPL